MSTELAKQNGNEPAKISPIDPKIMEMVLGAGDLAKLSTPQRLSYFNEVCQSVGLNPLTRPFEFITLNGKLQLYARRDCTDQLRRLHGINLTIVSREMVDGVYVVTAKARTRDGRDDESIGAVPIVKERNGNFVPLTPDERANVIMKAETKAKRRVTLSVCGLGWTDESEFDTVPGATRVNVDMPTPISEDDTFRDEWAKLMGAHGFTRDHALQVLDDGLKAKGKALADVHPKHRANMLSKAREGGYNHLLPSKQPLHVNPADGDYVSTDNGATPQDDDEPEITQELVADYAAFEEEFLESAVRRDADAEAARKFLEQAVGGKGKKTAFPVAKRMELLAAVRANAIDFATGKINQVAVATA